MSNSDNKTTIQSLQLQQMFSGSYVSLVTSILLAFILAFVQREVIAPTIIFVWLSVVVLLTISRAALVIHYQRSPKEWDSTHHSWLVKFRIGVIVSGVVWGLASFLMFPVNDPEHQMFLIFMLAGLTAGGLASYSADLVCAIGLSVSVLVPLAIRMFAIGSGLSVAMGVVISLYLGFMILSGRRSNQHIRDNIVLRLEASSREIAIRTSEEQYRLLLRHSPVGLFHYDANLVITYCNDRFADILKSKADHIVGLDMKTLKDQSILPTLRKALEGEIALYEGHYFATFSDADSWIAMTCAPSRDINEKVVGGIAIVQDITEKKLDEQAIKQSKEQLLAILNSTTESIFHVDRDGIILAINEIAAHRVHKEPLDMIGKCAFDFFPPEVAVSRRENLEEVFRTGKVKYTEDTRNGNFFSLNYYPIIDEQGKAGSVVVYAADISERQKMLADLRESEERFRQMFERHSAVMLLIEPQTGMIVDANPAAANFFGYPLIYLRGKTISSINIQSETEISNEIQQALIEQRNYFVFNHRLANDEIRTVEVHSSPVSFKSRNLLFAIIHDITDRKLAEEQIRHLAFHDALTKVPNRRLLNDRLDQTIAASKRSSRYGALMFLDLDNFKPLNDTHGHKVGDLLLIEAAHRISSCIRETDTVARFGGDEFVVLLSELKEDQSESTSLAGNVAEKIRASMSEQYRLVVKQDGNAEITVEHHCTSSIGVVVFDHQASRENILKWADMSMYEAKKAGRNCVVFSTQSSSKTDKDSNSSVILHLNWHNSYACGEPAIDDEHQKLFELANSLIDSAFTRNENPQKFDSDLERLLAHVVRHFADEETILARHHYNDLDAHAHDHKVLIEHALKLRDSALAGGVTIGELVSFLADEVIAQHMLKIDRKFFPLFNKG
jgi:diguanylate cyclase (GGDEF)-like protein/hemerythrin-like metal-binding protein/PAS domain S-box-containing protein